MPPKKRTIQDIKPSRKATAVRKKVAKTKQEAVKALSKEGIIPDMEPARKAKPSTKKSSGKKKANKSIWILVSAVFVFFLFTFSLLFSGATVVITPNNTVLPNGKVLLSGEKDSTTGLSFQTMRVEGERSLTAQSDGATPVNRASTGIVTLYNNHGVSKQNLLIDTRLVTSDGRIYKTKNAVSIPGKKTVNGESVPGQLDVQVYADVPGESGNVEMADFKILGFKGTSKENTFYGRSKTEISGGYTGELFSISEENAADEQEKVRSLLEDDLKAKLRAQIPEGFLLVDNGEEYKTTERTTYYEGDKEDIEIFEKGSLIGIIVDEDVLGQSLARETITTYEEGAGVSLNNLPALIVSYVGSPIGLGEIREASISVSGKPHLVWSLDEDKIKYDLVSTRRKQFETIMARYEYINKAKLKVRPFWRSSLPEDIEDIEIVYNLD